MVNVVRFKNIIAANHRASLYVATAAAVVADVVVYIHDLIIIYNSTIHIC